MSRVILTSTLAVLLLGPPCAAAQSERAWVADAGMMALGEAWDRNESREFVAGVVVGVDRSLWRGLAVRVEASGLRVVQQPEGAWLAGFTVGPRVRWRAGTTRPVVDVSVGLSQATDPVPRRGTTFNYLALIGAGVERGWRSSRVTVTGRWWHASNNGREGRHRNPDIQALGALVSVGWGH